MKTNRFCLIVGAGMAGLTAGRFLKAAGWSVLLLDKGRSFGGRMATRRIGASRLDHGAQFFTVRDSRFANAVRGWQSAGWVTPWFEQDGHVRYRATDGMNALAEHLARPLEVRRETKVKCIEPNGDGWLVTTGSGESLRAGTLLLTPPAPQSADLLAGCAERLPPDVISMLRSVDYDPCFSLLVTIDGPGKVPPPGYVRPASGPVEWIADNTRKGVSVGGAALTVHARADFSRNYFEAPKEDVMRLLLEAAEPWLGGQVTALQLHRWKYSRPVAADRPMCLLSSQPARLLIAGDGFGGPRLEGAFLSGLAAAEKIP
jgi:predicted NAD/FAD-dependent oxidoreductase